MSPSGAGPPVAVPSGAGAPVAGPAVVAIGGGTGLPVILRGVRGYASSVTAIVTVADDGGSSGRLRRELSMLPPGDIRNCLVALANDPLSLSALFQYRFRRGEGLTGHNLGNLIIAALCDIRGDFASAIDEAARLLACEGRVLPSTLEDVTLCAVTRQGDQISGQVAVAQTPRPLREVSLSPPEPHAPAATVQAIGSAGQIVIGPGSVFTSILPNLLVPDVRRAVLDAPAKKVYVCNVMSQRGETDLFTAYEHVEALVQHCGEGIIDSVVVNDRQPPADSLLAYNERGLFIVDPDADRISELGLEVLLADVIDERDPVRHDPQKVGEVLQLLA